MYVDLVRHFGWAPLAAPVLVVADQFLLFRVDGNDGLASPQSAFNGTVDMPELRVAIKDAQAKARELSQARLGPLAGGLSMPGF